MACVTSSGDVTFNPRARGEDRWKFAEACRQCLQSPRTRGKLVVALSVEHLHPSIRAHAGKTSRSLTLASSATFNPRARGEGTHFAQARVSLCLQSPRTRGRLNHTSSIWLRISSDDISTPSAPKTLPAFHAESPDGVLRNRAGMA